MFEIAKNVPIPPNKGNTRGAAPIYPFAQMEVGDCFDAPNDMGLRADGAGSRRQGTVSRCARQYAKHNNPTAKFTTRVIDENTVRCWRIA